MRAYTQPTATIVGVGTPKARKQEEVWQREKNDNFVFTGDANLRHTPAYYVGIFNVSDIEQHIERPWINPGRAGKVIVIPACETGQRYSKPFLIPDILQMPTDRAGSWELGTRGVDGKFLAQDALNPEEPQGNWKTVRTRLSTALSNEGTNLYHFGCFWEVCGPTGQNPPSEDALSKANERLSDTANRLIGEAELLSMQGPQGIRQIGFMHRWAANYTGQSFTWNTRYEKKSQCPSCGRELPVTASRCTGPNGCKYVFNWEKAISDGVASVDEAIAAGVTVAQAENMKRGRKKAEAAEE